MTNIKMPALSPTMTSGTLAKWLVKEGDNVKSGDIIAEIETDKATMELESIDDGIVNKILFKEGEQNIEVGTVIAKIGDDDQNDDETISILPSRNKDENLIITKNTITVREALRDAMAEEMRLDQNIFVMGEEVAEYQGAYKVTQGLLEEFGEKRVIDTPITEQGFAGLGVGAAFGGLKPIIEFMTFNHASCLLFIIFLDLLFSKIYWKAISRKSIPHPKLELISSKTIKSTPSNTCL